LRLGQPALDIPGRIVGYPFVGDGGSKASHDLVAVKRLARRGHGFGSSFSSEKKGRIEALSTEALEDVAVTTGKPLPAIAEASCEVQTHFEQFGCRDKGAARSLGAARKRFSA